MAFCTDFLMDNLNERNDTIQIQRSKSCVPGRKLPPVPNIVTSPAPTSHLKRQNGEKYQDAFLQEYSIFEEYLLLQKAQISDLYVVPSSNSPLIWNGVIFVKTGHYCGGAFRFNLVLPKDFPSEETPVVTFTPSIYHPLVHPETGVVNLGRHFSPWLQSTHQVWHILSHVKMIFSKPDVTPSIDMEASYELHNDLPTFKSKVKDCVNKCSQLLYTEPEDECLLRFTELSSDLLEQAKESVLRYSEATPAIPEEDLPEG